MRLNIASLSCLPSSELNLVFSFFKPFFFCSILSLFHPFPFSSFFSDGCVARVILDKYFVTTSPTALPVLVREEPFLSLDHSDLHYFDRNQILAIKEMSTKYPEFISVCSHSHKHSVVIFIVVVIVVEFLFNCQVKLVSEFSLTPLIDTLQGLLGFHPYSSNA